MIVLLVPVLVPSDLVPAVFLQLLARNTRAFTDAVGRCGPYRYGDFVFVLVAVVGAVGVVSHGQPAAVEEGVWSAAVPKVLIVVFASGLVVVLGFVVPGFHYRLYREHRHLLALGIQTRGSPLDGGLVAFGISWRRGGWQKSAAVAALVESRRAGGVGSIHGDANGTTSSTSSRTLHFV